ncbi:hypothetical protein GCM10022206_65350 [Streptomyces chiangmaiensis]
MEGGQLVRASGEDLRQRGTTVAAAVFADGLPTRRTLGIDPLSFDTPRRALATTPASDPDVVRDAQAVLTRSGATVTVVRDTAGSVAQRLVSSIVSVAAAIAERSIATPDDIDAAVTAGLGYPHGPLAWGELIAGRRLLTLQEGLHRTTGDPRYRPTRWVTERVELDLPLTFDRTEK